jgi:uncharacterized protein YbcI
MSTPNQKRAKSRSLGEIEASISDGIARFEQDYMGRGPERIQTHIIDDLVVVRLVGVLTTAEKNLVETLPAERGRDLLKQVRTQLVETARPILEKLILASTGVRAVSLHHDISVVSGEEVMLFTLTEAPSNSSHERI